jgi:hypothetical protein
MLMIDWEEEEDNEWLQLNGDGLLRTRAFVVLNNDIGLKFIKIIETIFFGAILNLT